MTLALVEAPAIGRGISLGDITEDQLRLVKHSICRPKHREATNDELALFIGQCNRTGLDPFARQIYAIFRKENFQDEGGNWSKREVMGIQTSIDGFRLIAQRTGRYDGQLDTEWCGPSGVWSEIWAHPEPPFAARSRVLKAGAAHATPGIAHWSEYVVMYDGNPTGLWRPEPLGMPRTMLAKCSEALALRKAFPQELSGIYTEEEMARTNALAVTEATLVEEPVAPALPPHSTTDTAQELDAANVDLMEALEFTERKRQATFDASRTVQEKRALNKRLLASCEAKGIEVAK